MKLPFLTIKPGWIAALLIFGALTSGAFAADLKLEAQLIWGTKEAVSPDPNYKPADAEVRKKLAGLPLKWAHYFEVNRKQFTASPAQSQRVELSEKCSLEVKNLGGDKVEVALIGRGKAVWKGTQPLPKNEILVLGGNAPDEGAWLVTLKRVE